MLNQNFHDLANAMRRCYTSAKARRPPDKDANAMPMILEVTSRDLGMQGGPHHAPVTGRIMREHLSALRDLVPELRVSYDSDTRKIRLQEKSAHLLPAEFRLTIAERALREAKEIIDRFVVVSMDEGNLFRTENGRRRFANDCETLGID